MVSQPINRLKRDWDDAICLKVLSCKLTVIPMHVTMDEMGHWNVLPVGWKLLILSVESR